MFSCIAGFNIYGSEVSIGASTPCISQPSGQILLVLMPEPHLSSSSPPRWHCSDHDAVTPWLLYQPPKSLCLESPDSKAYTIQPSAREAKIQRSDNVMFPPWSPHLLQQSDSNVMCPLSLSQHHYPWKGTHGVHCTTPGPLLTQATHELCPSGPSQLYPMSLNPKHFISFSLILFLLSLLLLPLSSNWCNLSYPVSHLIKTGQSKIVYWTCTMYPVPRYAPW